MILGRPGVQFIEGVAEVLLWAPKAKSVALALADMQIPMERGERGYWHLRSNVLKHGDDYWFLLDGERRLPDPASLSQPDGVHESSRAVDISRFAWTDNAWPNLPLDDYILYELHTGAFSSTGNFAGIEAKLDYLKDLGITAVSIMPVAAFPGARNWGYDGVFPYAVHNAYGGAEGLMRLVDACHAKGLTVVLDVVYNHLGPEGNYLDAFGPYFTDAYRTPWGAALNFDQAGYDGVRHFFIQNAIMWLRDFHIDAIRMDAVHAIWDFSAKHILQELREELDQVMEDSGRMHYLIVESDQNDARLISPVSRGGYGMDAQWMDEFHHALRVAAGQPQSGYYADFNGIEHLAKSYADAYVYDGIYSPHREKTFGNKTDLCAGRQFVVFSQNHDQVGNRMLGERSSQLYSFEMQKLLAGAIMLSPFLPMLFMGEEYSETNPFLYFISHGDAELVEAVRAGRKAEFAAFHAQGEAPDPQAEATFMRSKLQWELLSAEPHATMLRYYKALIAMRKREAALRHPDRSGISASADASARTLLLTRSGEGQRLSCYMNFSKAQQAMVSGEAGLKLFDSSAPEWGGPHAAPDTIPPHSPIHIQPESILIYSHNE